MNLILTPFKLAGTALALTAATSYAATYTNTAGNPSSSTWNSAGFWSSTPAAVSPSDNYQVNPDATRVTNNTPIATSFAVKLGGTTTAWGMYGFVRDYDGNAPAANSSFAGNKVILTDKTAFRSFNRNFTSTANWELQSGSYMVLNAGGSGSTTAWNGSITTAGTTAIGLVTNNGTTLTINASLGGTGTLNLVQSGGSVGTLNLAGNISGFTGTLFLSNGVAATLGTGGGNTTAGKTINTGTFSISNSASFATLQLNYESPLFRYNLSTNNVSFASLILTNDAGTNNVLGAGIYDVTALNGLTGNAGIFSGTGTITVVPEPSTYAAGLVGLLIGVIAMRRRHAVSAA